MWGLNTCGGVPISLNDISDCISRPGIAPRRVGGSRLMSPRHLKHASQSRWGPFLALVLPYLTLGSPWDRPGRPAASSCNRAPARILEFVGLWRRRGRASCTARSFIEREGCLPSGDSLLRRIQRAFANLQNMTPLPAPIRQMWPYCGSGPA